MTNDDLISREALIKAIEDDYNNYCNRQWVPKFLLEPSDPYAEGVRDEYNDILEIIQSMKAVNREEK